MSMVTDALRILSTKEKALKINLTEAIYGSFAEIGAGQEVAANFFKAGGASGTVAKTMSAYDMAFSDAIYGRSSRYVSEQRLQLMLDKEFGLLEERLEKRIETTSFFSFANTVEALNFQRTNRGHAWLGLKFQLRAQTETNECVLHCVLKDRDPLLQQDALGILGVNLIFACYFIDDPEAQLLSLFDNLSKDRIEIDMYRLDGPDFPDVDNRLMSLKLVKNGFTRAALFGPDGTVLQPSEALYKKNVLILRGRFRPVTHVNVDMLFCAYKRFKKEAEVMKDNMLLLTELTLSDLNAEGAIDEEDFLSRVDLLCSLGQNVLISNYTEYYRLARHITRLTKDRLLGIILGIYNLERLFDESYYESLHGGILEAFGILFGRNVKFYVYPSITKDKSKLYGLDDLVVADKHKSLLQYLKDNNKLASVKGADMDNLNIVSDRVLEMIQNNEPNWELCVPSKVARAIKENGLFGCAVEPKQQTKPITT